MFVAHHPALRTKAIELRQAERLTIDQLAERLALPRTTIFYWVRHIPIERVHRGTPAQRNGTRAMQAAFRRKREEAYVAGISEFDDLAEDPTFRDFVCMYIGEGYKRSRNQVAIANSDPSVVLLGHRWLTRLSRNPVTQAVQYHADQDLDELRGFWGDLLGVAPAAVAVHRKSNSQGLAGRRWRSAHGVLTVRTGDTYLRARLDAWMARVKEAWA